MDRFEEMRNFVRVIDAGSITRAADLGHVAKSAVSRRLSDLEVRLGVQLINRTTRRMTLTDAGQRFYGECTRLLAELNEVEANVVSAEAALTGRIRLAAPTVFGTQHLGPAINAFLENHPDIQFDIEFNDRQIDIIEEGIDLAVRIATLSDSRMIARRLAPITGLVSASPDYWKVHGKPKTPDGLAAHHGMHYSNRTSTTWRYHTANGRSGSVRVPAILQANNGDFLRDAAIAGRGVILQPKFICYEAVKAGLLEPVLTRYKWIDLSVYAIYPNTRNLPRRIRAFIDFLAELWSGCPYWEDC